MSLIVLLAGGLAVAAIGFLAGLFMFRLKARWCPACGAWTTDTGPDRYQLVVRR